ncbi:MAG: hypothetical protein VKL39_00915, partial [Leptolyngbyaceae bacterium]|nr:hypothetical protein [Leptolyngbyaceae bacterium]
LPKPLQTGNVLYWEIKLFLFRCEVHTTEQNIHHILTVKTRTKDQWIYSDSLFTHEAVEEVIKEWLKMNQTAGVVSTLPSTWVEVRRA